MIGGLLKSTSSLAILAAAGLLIGGVTLAPKAARAADLGGDCCADLEERVANLEATTVRKGNRKVSLTISGRMAYTMTYFLDNSGPAALAPNGANPTTQDAKSDFYVSDNSGNGPAMFFDGSGKVNSDIVVGYHMELDYNLSGANSQNTRQGGNAISNGDTFVYVSSKTFGRVNLGHLDGVVDDFGGDGFATGYVVGMQGSLRGTNAFWLRDAAGLNSGITYSKFFSGLDSASDTGIKYISPVFANWLTVEAAYTGDDTWSVGANLSGNISKTLAVKLGAAYSSGGAGDGVSGGKQAFANQNGKANIAAISGGINETGSGLFLQGDYAIAYANADLGVIPNTFGLGHTMDMTTWEILGGWHKNVSGIGNTELWGSYQHSTNQLADNTSGSAYQIGIDQAIDAASSHVFLTYENYNASVPAGTLSASTGTPLAPTGGPVGSQNLSTIIAGMAITF